jgi:hypothetical protein
MVAWALWWIGCQSFMVIVFITPGIQAFSGINIPTVILFSWQFNISFVLLYRGCLKQKTYRKKKDPYNEKSTGQEEKKQRLAYAIENRRCRNAADIAITLLLCICLKVFHICLALGK